MRPSARARRENGSCAEAGDTKASCLVVATFVELQLQGCNVRVQKLEVVATFVKLK
jgi:hypothetical protein